MTYQYDRRSNLLSFADDVTVISNCNNMLCTMHERAQFCCRHITSTFLHMICRISCRGAPDLCLFVRVSGTKEMQNKYKFTIVQPMKSQNNLRFGY